MEQVLDAEEFLAGMGVNWKQYTPPGGEEWSTHFKTDLEPIIKKSRSDALATLAKLKEKEAKIDEMQRHFQAISKSLIALDELASGKEESSEFGLPSTIRDGQGRAMAASIEESRLALLSHKPRIAEDMAEVESDIKFMADIALYINADRELDKLLFALYTVEIKFRAKILREAGRLLKIVESVRAELRGSHSTIKAMLRERLDPIFATLDEAYAKCGPEIRKLKKVVDKHGLAAWDAVVPPPGAIL